MVTFLLRLFPILFSTIILSAVYPSESTLSPKDDGKTVVVSFDDIPAPAYNPMTQKGIALGKKLFFDPKLSGNNTMACASCHKPQYAFADTVRFPLGINGKHIGRNAMSLCNLAWQPFYFWDGRSKQLEDLVISPITNAHEMAQDTTELLRELNADAEYLNLFKNSFQIKKITFLQVKYALGQYLRSIVSQNAPIQQLVAEGKKVPDCSDRQVIKNLLPYASDKVVEATFLCLTCHSDEQMFGGLLLKNNGLIFDKNNTNNEFIANKLSSEQANRTAITQNFKAPTLRNIAFTAPYMHDGRFRTLDEVIEHYNSGIQDNPNLGHELRDEQGKPIKLGLSSAEKKQMIRFLQTFSDSLFIQRYGAY